LVPRLFRLSREPRYVVVAMRYLLVATGYGLLAAGGCWLIAPYSDWLLGADFQASAATLRFLSLYVIVNCMRRVVTDLLTAADRQWWRNGIEGGSLVFIITANLLAMPHFGWRGTAAAAISA